MSQPGDRIIYMGNGANGTTAATAYQGTLARVNAPGGWGLNDVTVNVGGTVTTIVSVRRDTMLTTGLGAAVHPNGMWRLMV